jgi:hypothetical protein
MQTLQNNNEQIQHPVKKLWIYIVVALVLIVGGMIGWSYFRNNKAKTADLSTESSAQIQSDSDCDKFSNKQYGFSVSIPKNYTYTEKTSGINNGGLYQVVFSNKDLGAGYQVTVTVADKGQSLGLVSAAAKEVTIGGREGKNFNDVAYVVDAARYSYWITADEKADRTLKIMAKSIAKNFAFLPLE